MATTGNDLGKFIEKYKELEGILRNSDSLSILQYEETLSASDMERLRICRQIRNYVQHHDDGSIFLTATPAMTVFLESLIQSENAKRGMVKDKLYRLSPLSYDDTLGSGLERYANSKREWMPVVDCNGIYLGSLSLLQFVQIYNTSRASTKLKSLLSDKAGQKLLQQIQTVERDDLLEGLAGRNLVVIGKEKKYLGIVKW